ncbi:MAG TPA: methylated-DNA--[protein]-cysteine S-methyltransferase [Candidatus Saccharimonadales bacterium]|nr:methylated-DNA--[protein]-cysteine S-methyltransferase [Candidatus Saccharimonadales bacterium]
MVYYTFHDTPAGRLLLMSDGRALTGAHWVVFKRAPQVMPGWVQDDTLFVDIRRQFDEYFAGSRDKFEVEYRFEGTDFQKSVWRELEKVPYGVSSSYAAIAAAIGKPKAVRAVGTAVGSNPVSVIVPCHRVLTSTGAIGGYAGGLSSKMILLSTEKILLRA